MKFYLDTNIVRETFINFDNIMNNDGFDYWNLVYSTYADFFVSNDKIYKRLKNMKMTFLI